MSVPVQIQLELKRGLFNKELFQRPCKPSSWQSQTESQRVLGAPQTHGTCSQEPEETFLVFFGEADSSWTRATKCFGETASCHLAHGLDASDACKDSDQRLLWHMHT